MQHRELTRLGIDVRIRRHARARRVSMQLSDDSLRVTLPGRAPLAAARQLIDQHLGWIVERRESQQQRDDDARHELGLTPGHVLLRGRPTSLDDLPKPIEHHLRELARADIETALDHRRDVARRPWNRLTIRDQRTRWGSCSTRGTLSFNFRLIMAPPAVLDYLVVHELSHLDVPNHSRAFWNAVAANCADYKEHEAWLNRFGGTLLRWRAPT
ncbi:MAG: SprT family zinc-dependent metalloprotease [Planctomycetota bacterium]